MFHRYDGHHCVHVLSTGGGLGTSGGETQGKASASKKSPRGQKEHFARISQKNYDEILLGFSQKHHKILHEILQYKSVGLDRIDENKCV